MTISVEEFYKDKTIFVTGGSGYMGKVLIEKLLYSCSDLKQIIILLREKRGKSAEIRVKEFKLLPMFERIMNEKPEMMNKIYPVWGDISETNFRLSEANMSYILENTQIVFHLAASLKVEAPLKTNVAMNLTAVKQMCDIAKKMRNLIVMIHTSTAFCIVEHVNVDEKVYDVVEDPLKVIETVANTSEKELAALQSQMLGKHLNTYTYTKRLSEVLVRDEFEKFNLPACIVRPSMVEPSFAEPLVGWVDSPNGSPGIVIAVARGALRCMLLDKKNTKNFIPVDLCMNAYIMAAKQIASLEEKPKEIPVFNLTMHKSNSMTMGQYTDLFENMIPVSPFVMSLGYPNITYTTNKYYYYICIFLFQWIPALLIDFLLLLFGQKRMMIKIQKKLFIGVDSLKCFVLHNFAFATSNFEKLLSIQNEEERKTFFIDTKTFDVTEYFIKTCYGGRTYLGREPLSTLPKARVILRIHQLIYWIFNGTFFYWIAKKLLMYSGLMAS